MTVLVDMDDVIEQLAAGWVEYINDKYGTSVSPNDLHDWDISKAFPMLTHNQVYAALNDDRLWDYVIPMPGAPEALKQLIDEGHSVYIVTATGYQTLRAKMEKVLFRYFPFISWKQVIITEYKHLIDGDILVDDGPHNLQGGKYRKILFNANHNQWFDETTVGAARVHNWNEAYAEIVRIASEVQ